MQGFGKMNVAGFGNMNVGDYFNCNQDSVTSVSYIGMSGFSDVGELYW